MSLRFSVSARVASLGLPNALIKNLGDVYLQLKITLSPCIRFLNNFVDYRAEFALSSDVRIIEIGLQTMKL